MIQDQQKIEIDTTPDKVFEIIEALPSMRVFKNTQEMDEYLDRMQKQVTGEITEED